jgi:hypothetical protein
MNLMVVTEKLVVALFVDRATQQWVVRDAHGDFWSVSMEADAWNRRLPFVPTDDSELVSVPGHYRYLLRIPISDVRD